MRAALALLALTVTLPALAQQPVRLYAAGSLRGALNEVIASFKDAKVEAVYGPSGLLRDRIAKGEPAEVFASANMEHPATLSKAGKAGPVRRFARNRLCALAAPGLKVARAALEKKALNLTGGPDSPPPPKDRSQYGLIVAEGKADVFLTYCTNALEARREHPAQQVVQVPEELAVAAEYGLVLVEGAREQAWWLAQFILSPRGQAIFAKHGFAPGDGK
jgi:ABC-type molybdate transport system substrate-binding protein